VYFKSQSFENVVKKSFWILSYGKILVFLLNSFLVVRLYATDSTKISFDYVDLGLPSGTLWATCNLGADKPEDVGSYYSWGETKTKEDYSLKHFKWYSMENHKYLAYCTDSIYGVVDSVTVLKNVDDAATMILGSEWRIPTREEVEELINECEWRWVSDYYTEVTGKLGTSKRNGNNFFSLPLVMCMVVKLRGKM